MRRVEHMGRVERMRGSIATIAVIVPLLLALLVLAGPQTAHAQTAASEQYQNGVDLQVPVGPSDPAHSGLADNQEPPQTGSSQQVDPTDKAQDGVDPQVPVGPNDPAHPGLAAQPQQTFGPTLADVSPPALDSTQQTVQYLAQHLQQLLWAKQAADYQAQQQQQLQPSFIETGLASVAPDLASMLLESKCNNARIWIGAPDGSDPNDFGHDPLFGTTDFSDVAESCSM